MIRTQTKRETKMNRKEAKRKTEILRKIIKACGCVDLSVTTGKCGAEIKSKAAWMRNADRAALAGLGITTTTPNSVFVPFDPKHVMGGAREDIDTLLRRLSGLCNLFKNLIDG